MRAGALLLLAGLGVRGCTGGCASMPLPPEPTREERERIAATRLPFAVAVERHEPPVYSDHLVGALRATRLFGEVDYAERLAEPAPLVARVERLSQGAAVIPILTAVSLGLVPTLAEEVYGLGFSIAPVGVAGERLELDYRWRGTAVLGWVSLVLNLSPDRSEDDPRDHARYAERVAAVVAARRDEIEALAARARR